MINEKLPNHRDGKCCMTCMHYHPTYDGDGACGRYAKNEYDLDYSSRWYQICDEYENILDD